MSDFNEAVVLIAKCGESHKTYGMRLEKTGHDRWLTTWAFPIKESSAKREGYDKVQVKGDISFADDYPLLRWPRADALFLRSFELYYFEKRHLHM